MENAQTLYNILVVEDNKNLVLLIESKLRKYPSLKVRVSFDLTDAMRKISEEKPDILLLDTEFKEEGGKKTSHGFYTKLKETDGRGVYVIPMSSDEGYRKEWKELGLNNFLEKPFKKDSLEKEIGEAIDYLKSKTPSET